MIESIIKKSNEKNIKSILKKFKQYKIKLWLENDNLRFKAPKGVMSDEILNFLKLYKEDIISELKRQEAKKIFLKPIELIPKQNYYSLSSAQKRVYYIQNLDPESTAYNLTQVLWIDGEIDIKRIQDIIRTLITRHEMLRTSIKVEDNRPVLEILDNIDFNLDYEELEYNKEKIDLEILKFVKPFKLEEAPLFRVKCIKILKDRPAYLLIYDIHHLISDGISIGLLVQEVNQLYDNQITHDPKIQYKDYINWQKNFKKSDEYKIQKLFWHKQFLGEIPLLDLITDFPRPAVFDFHGNTIKFSIDKDLCDKLYKISRDNNTTLYSLLLSCYFIFLQKYSSQNDIVVGTPTAGRRHADLYNILGIFVNSLALRMKCDDSLPFQEFLNQVSQYVLTVFDHQEYQLDELVSDLKIARSQSRNPLFDTMFVLQNMNIGEVLINNARVSYYDFPVYHSQFDITLTAIENENGIDLEFEYCTKLFKQKTIKRMQRHFLNIIKQVCDDVSIKINSLSLTDNEEKKVLLEDFNSKKINYPDGVSLNEIFDDIVKSNSDKTAVKYIDEQLSYEELDKKSNKLAQILIKEGIKKESVAALYLERNIDTVVSILGVLKSGAAFLPIDNNYPSDRIKYMLSDSNADILITNINNLDENLFDGKVINLNNTDFEQINDIPVGADLIPESLCYIIYTSGTTGRPKGVMVEHGNLINLLYAWKHEYLDNMNKINLLQLSSFAFDVFFADFIRSILTGGCMVICPSDDRLDPEKIVSMIENNKISLLDATPAVIIPLMDLVHSQGKNISSIEVLITGSDKVSVDDFNLLCDRFEHKFRILNCFGITETTIDSCYFERKKGKKINSNNTPIGKPLPNMKFYVLNENGNPVPIGVPGELYISGSGVVRGYFNNVKLTAEKFLPDSFDKDKKMYKTGDKVRWLDSGNIEFLGRIDHQIKVRGYRIEVGEIESALNKFEGIKNTYIAAKKEDNGTNNLCAYIESDIDINNNEIKKFLKSKLPNYMVPVYYVVLEKFPLTDNGKIDHRSLPQPGFLIDSVNYEAPESEKEKLLTEIWQNVLNVSKIGITDNFFDLGGDSIKAIQVISKILNAGYRIEIKDLFENPDIKSAALKLSDNTVVISQDEINGEIPLTPIQKWLFKNNNIPVNHFNQAVMLYKKDRFDSYALKKIFTKLVLHHDSLRIVYKKDNNKIIQYNRNSKNNLFDYYEYDFTGKNDLKSLILEKTEDLHREIDLENGPLVKLSLFKTDDGDHLLIIIHHLVVDGISWRVLLEDFTQAYNDFINNKEIKLLNKTHSFKYWSEKLTEYSNNKKFLMEIPFWKSIEAAEYEILADNYDNKDNNIDFLKHDCRLDRKHTELLLKKVNQAYNTDTKDILLAGLGIALKNIFNKKRFLINLESHGREEIFKDINLTRTVGWFTSQYPMILDASTDNYNDIIKKIKEVIRNIPYNGIGYGIMEYLTDSINKKELKFNLVPDITFNYLGQFDNEIDNDIFSVSDITTGEWNDNKLKREQLIDINGLIAKDELSFNFEYNPNVLSGEIIKNLSEEFIRQLKKIINHCVSKESIEYTPSDFKLKNYNTNDFNYILSCYPENSIEKIYYLSPMQEGMLFHSLLDEGGSVYFEQSVFYINGDINIGLLEKSITHLIKRHDILRTRFVSRHIKRPVQVVLKNEIYSLDFHDFSESEKTDKEIVKDFQVKDRQKGFDLQNERLFRISVLKLNDGKSSIILSFHHIIMDGWCIGLIMNEIFNLYSMIKDNKKIELPEAVPFSNYINWIEDQDHEKALEYWKNYLQDFETISEINFKNKSSNNKYEVENFTFKIDKKKSGLINELIKKNNTTLSTFIQMLWGILLQRYNNNDDVLFGVVNSGRQSEIESAENIIGLFINTIPLRIMFEKDSSINEILKVIQKDFLNSQKNSYVRLSDIQNLTSLRNNLIDHVMIFENYPVDPELLNGNNKLGFVVEDVESFEQTNYDLNVVVYPGDEIKINFNYNKNVYKESDVIKIKEHFCRLADQIIINPEIKIRDIEIITDEEKDILINRFNKKDIPINLEDNILSIFSKQVSQFPNDIAVVFKDKKYTYKEIDDKSSSLASTLYNLGVKREEVIALMVDRSFEMIIGILGILKSGAAYLPIDPGYPMERKKYIIKDSNCSILLTNSEINRLDDSDLNIFNLDDSNVYSDDLTPISIDYKSSDLCYIIYTSGSTGKPKGVLLEQKGLMNLVSAQCESFGIKRATNVLQFASFGFDASVSEIFTSLLSGAVLHLFTDDITELYNVLKSSSINVVTLPPSILRAISPDGLTELKTVISAGESCDNAIVKKWSEGRNFINAYGPTESTVCASMAVNPDPNGVIHIGKPMNNIEIFIINKYGKMQPAGFPGELCISGIGLARGYLNNPELSNEKFIPHPYIENKIIYKTGDLARWLNDGNIEFLGRIDHQVKIRGFRIELQEIESVLVNHDLIDEACVTVIKNNSGDPALCAYYVSKDEIDKTNITEYLKGSLPDYMIPSFFIYLNKMPINSSGKIDRRALKEKEIQYAFENEYVPPSNDLERDLQEIWKKVLNAERVGMNDSFFEIGGDSIKVMEIIAEAEKRNIFLSVRNIFQNKTISLILKNIDTDKPVENNDDPDESDLSENITINTSGKNIENKKILPAIIQRDITTYLHRSLPLCIIRAFDYYDNWFYSRYIQLISHTSPKGYTELDYIEHRNNMRDIGTLITLGYKHYKYNSVVNDIIEKINDGFYSIIHLDEYYLKDKWFYKKTHFVHSSLVYGYDKNKEKIYAIGFNKDHIFKFLEFGFSEFEKAFERGKIHYKESASWCEWSAVQFFDPHERAYPYIEKKIISELDQYILSKEDMVRFFDFSFDGYEVTYGHSVYNVVKKCFEESLKGSNKIDYRAVHLLWEHQKGLFERLLYLDKQNNYKLNLKEKLNSFDEIIEKFNKVRLRYFEFTYTNEEIDFVNKDLFNDVISMVSYSEKKIYDLLTPIVKELNKLN